MEFVIDMTENIVGKGENAGSPFLYNVFNRLLLQGLRVGIGGEKLMLKTISHKESYRSKNPSIKTTFGTFEIWSY